MKWECMRSKAVYTLACVQIAIGVLLFFGTIHMAFSLMPKVRDSVSRLGKSLADAAEALREDNKTYNEVVAFVFSLREFIGDNAQDIGAFGSQVVSTGLRLHLDCIRDIGTSIVRGVATLRKGLGVVDEFRDNAHPQNSRSINDAAAALDEVSKLMLNGSKVETYGGWVCLLGVLVSLLFVMNGLVLLVIGNNNSGRDR